ncbi:DUF6612 family protein [Virgibacillus doumboii]|uniref:DUF6612 family protein n=1 Tax=Virgibacillus doumboii TaxID=2697503 RepID=UPI0013E0C0AC|nr:DUF6612 family protein [Virgibacillus doumboii]
MKKIIVLMGIGFLLMACSANGNTENDAAAGSDEIKEEQSATENTSDQENTEKENEDQQDVQNNSENKQQNGTENGKNESKQQNDSEEKQPENDEAQNNQQNTAAKNNENTTTELTDASVILQKSSTTMANLQSLSFKGSIMSDSTINGTRRKENTKVDGKILLDAPVNLHQNIHLQKSDAHLEMYLTDDKYYVKENQKWITMPAEYAENNLYNAVTAKQLKAYAEYGAHFQVTTDKNHYILNYDGTNEEFKEIVFKPGKKVLNEFFRDFFHNMQLSGIYELIIDKETFHLTNYRLRYEGVTSGAAGEGRIHEISDYQYYNFNAYDQINIPENVIHSAEPVN